MRKLVLNMVLVLAIIYMIPFILYGATSVLTGLNPPAGVSPACFLVSVLVSKLGTAISFVLFFYITRESLKGRWFLYASLWWFMYVIGEIGQAIGPHYSWQEAFVGIISETIYWPLSSFVTNWILAPK